MIIQSPANEATRAILDALNVECIYSPGRGSRTYVDLASIELTINLGAYLVINKSENSGRHSSIVSSAITTEQQAGSKLCLGISKSDGASILTVPANVQISYALQEGVVLDQRECKTGSKQLLISDSMLKQALKSEEQIFGLAKGPTAAISTES
jgi:hypothetical protein